ncbi:MAG: ATP-binding cassette domain-containing protein [Verrucomicrobiae bacterium]|nr:ATP-binding cassette domain-containing protein [Verrucomicrobiae bacterium]MCP5520530.1 ATP-binding cassette domain-containing protein [Verrucomicrobiales bacterium]
MNAVQITGVTKCFGDHVAVENLALAVPRGSIYGFIGPNGSGKTTTLRMIMNILQPDTGSIEVLGESLRGACSARVGYLPEERGLYRKMKVREVLRFYGELKAGRRVNREVDEWLERFGLLDRANEKVETLSKGMSQKAQFIATVVASPELVILDEPFSGLDPVNANLITKAVLDLRKAGATVILSTHDMGTAERMCDFIFMIHRGRKVLDGTLEDIQARYGQDTVRTQIEPAGAGLEELPGVTQITDFGHLRELRLQPDADPQRVLEALMQRGQVRHFAVIRPSLHDIFVRIAGDGESIPEGGTE